MTWSIVLGLCGWAAGWFLWGRPRRLDQALDEALGGGSVREATRAPVSVVIPARNEAAVISGLLADVVAQLRADDVVIVVDDHSTDDTATVAAQVDPRVVVISSPDLPPGWMGKSWACHTGVEAVVARGARAADLIVFLDADVRLAPGALDAVRDLACDGAVVSVQPFHVTRRPDEQLSLFCGLVALGALGAGHPGRQPSGLCGPLIATTLGDYRRSGGHAGVRTAVIEDVEMGKRYTDAGIAISVLLGGSLVRYRMYPRDLAQLTEGWTKNLASGAGAVPLWRTAAAVLWITALGGAAGDLVTALAGGTAPQRILAVLAYGVFVTQVAALGRRTGTFPWRTALLYPIPLTAFVALFLRSVWRTHVRREVRWRGRDLPTGRARAGR